jgi:protein-tyrosine-phosphatase
MKVLFVCSGNTCRSPMAKALAQALATERGVSFSADSAGLYAQGGSLASDNAVRAMREDHGLDIGAHRAKAVDKALVDWADVVVCMTAAQQSALLGRYPDAKVTTLGAWGEGAGDVADPFGGSLATYRACAVHIRGLILNAVERIFGQ